RGNVFYRVERGGPFVVATAAGSVTVLGTCFRVEVQEMKKTWIAGATGAAVSAALLVTVYEGRVLLAKSHGSLELGAGEHGHAAAGAAPTHTEGAENPALVWTNTLLAARVHKLEDQLRETQKQVQSGDEVPMERRFAIEPRDPDWAPREERLVRE